MKLTESQFASVAAITKSAGSAQDILKSFERSVDQIARQRAQQNGESVEKCNADIWQENPELSEMHDQLFQCAVGVTR